MTEKKNPIEDDLREYLVYLIDEAGNDRFTLWNMHSMFNGTLEFLYNYLHMIDGETFSDMLQLSDVVFGVKMLDLCSIDR